MFLQWCTYQFLMLVRSLAMEIAVKYINTSYFKNCYTNEIWYHTSIQLTADNLKNQIVRHEMMSTAVDIFKNQQTTEKGTVADSSMCYNYLVQQPLQDATNLIT